MRVIPIALLLALAAAAIATAGSAGGADSGWRPATNPERRAIADAIYGSEFGDKQILFVHVLRSNPQYATAGWRGPTYPKKYLTTSLVQLLGGRWRLRYHIGGFAPDGGRATADGACAVAPAAVVHALYGYRCSFTWRQLHARPATPSEARVLRAALNHYLNGSSLPQHLRQVCISRVAPNWAAAWGPGYVWFKRNRTGWGVAHFEGDRTPKPAHAVILSLGSCVGYFPSDYY